MKHIYVKQNYGGRLTNEQRILPGEYDITDERLFGAGEYLIANGYAVVTSETVDPIEAELEEVLGDGLSPEPTKKELTERLEKLGVAIPHNANKATLIQLLADHDSV